MCDPVAPTRTGANAPQTRIPHGNSIERRMTDVACAMGGEVKLIPGLRGVERAHDKDNAL